tara:strand:+ start:30089 stop:30808 length:720 start_codon:yes stop_codon:yes gene_type:complete
MEYKVVVVNNLVDHTDNALAMTEIGKIWKVRKAAFDVVHKSKYFPLSQDDFFGINVAILDALTEKPVVVFKVIPHSYCTQYENVEFPYYKLIEANCDQLTVTKIKKYINAYVLNGKDISYSGGWAENLHYKGRGLSGEFKELYTAMHYWVHKHYNLHAILGAAFEGAKPFEFFTKGWGLDVFSDHGFYLPVAPHAKCRLIRNDVSKLSDYTYEVAKKWEHLWDSRLTIGTEKDSVVEAA